MSRVEGKYELELMRGYEQQFRHRLSLKVCLSYDCLPLNVEEYQSQVSMVLQQMKLINPSEKDLSKYDQVILGRIEGQLGTSNFKQIIQSVVGEISEEKFKLYLKQKTQQRTYGLNGKDKMSIVRQIKKLQSLKKYFNLQQINKKRKYNKLYSSALKNLAKYFELYDKIDPTNGDSIQSAFLQYTNYTKQQKKFNNFVKQLETGDMKDVVEKPLILEEKVVVNSGDNVQPIEQEQKIDQQQINQAQFKGKQSPSKNDKKQNQQNQNKTAKKKQKSKSKPQKVQQTIVNEANSGQGTEKQKVQGQDKELKAEKEKTQKKQQKQKTNKKPQINNRAITQFFVVKKKQTTQQPTLLQFKSLPGQDANNIVEGQKQVIKDEIAPQNVGVKNSIWQKFSLKGRQQQQKQQSSETQQSQISMSQLRSEFRSLPMESQQYNPIPYYTNIIMTLSTLEYFNYFMSPTPIEINFAHPFQKIEQVQYFEDESQQFEGQSADQEQEQQEEMEQGSMMSDNNTILSNDYLSNQELSSCEPFQIDLKVEYGKANKWIFGQANKILSEEELMNIVDNFSMICLQDLIPLKLQQQQDDSDKVIITPEMWRDVYKMAHGYYGTKQNIIKEITTIIPGVSKTWIDTMLKERSQKIVNQRYIKKQFIDDIKQRIPQIQQILDDVINERNEQLRRLKAQKNYQKDQKLQKDILECTGSRYIVNLLKQLKQKGYKQLRRNHLMDFINERIGQEWEKIKVEINSMSRPIVEMLKVMNNGEDRIDEEVVVQDQEYNKTENNQEVDKNTGQKVQNQKKTKKTLKQKQQKLKIKKRKQNNTSTLQSIYEKTKPISRARKTKNSLKTGIVSIDELKKQKQQENQDNQKVQNEQNLQEQLENEEQGQENEIEIQENLNEDEDDDVDEDIEDQKNDENEIVRIEECQKGRIMSQIQNVHKQVVQLDRDLDKQGDKNLDRQGDKNGQQQACTQEKEEIKQNSQSINPSKSSETVAIADSNKIEAINQQINQ